MKKYLSRITNLRIVITPGRPVYEAGQRVGDVPGKYAKFEGGEFQTDDKETIKKLESLPTFGRDFYLASEEKAPQAPKEDDLTKKTKKELLSMAEEKGIKVEDSATKDDIIKLLNPTQEQ